MDCHFLQIVVRLFGKAQFGADGLSPDLLDRLIDELHATDNAGADSSM